MAKKVSKFFRIGVEGDTCDGRVISAQDIQEMAETFDPRVYGCRINLEHLRASCLTVFLNVMAMWPN